MLIKILARSLKALAVASDDRVPEGRQATGVDAATDKGRGVIGNSAVDEREGAVIADGAVTSLVLSAMVQFVAVRVPSAVV